MSSESYSEESYYEEESYASDSASESSSASDSSDSSASSSDPPLSASATHPAMATSPRLDLSKLQAKSAAAVAADPTPVPESDDEEDIPQGHRKGTVRRRVSKRMWRERCRCFYCGQLYSNAAYLQMHKDKRHPGRTTPQATPRKKIHGKPTKCERCRKVPPQIRLFDKKTGRVQFICYGCRDTDSLLRNMPVSPRQGTIEVPHTCQRCRTNRPQIKMVDKKNNTTSYICYPCRDKDAFLASLPVSPRGTTVDAADKCAICKKNRPQLKKFDKSTGQTDFVCRPCVEHDELLRTLPVSPRGTVHVPDYCMKCHKAQPNIRAHDKTTGEDEFFCRACIAADPVYSKKPISPRGTSVGI